MTDVSDMELLQNYTRQGSEEDFAVLVRRHINLVHSAALRHVGSAAHAEEITQAVFIILARKAASLHPDTVLAGWIYETTRLTSLSFLRGERRRRFREQEAYMQSTLHESNRVSVWNQMSPLLDEAMSRLGKKDREAVVLRFFKEKNLGEVAAELNVTEGAAQRRVHRALEKLHHYFNKRGVILTTAVIAGELSANSVHAAPMALVKSVTSVATVKGSIATASTSTLVKGTLNIMTWMKAKIAIVIGASTLIVAGATLWQVQDPKDLFFVLDRTPAQVTILPARYPTNGFAPWAAKGDRQIGLNQTAEEVVEAAYGGNFNPVRTVISVKFPEGKFDFIANLTNGSFKAFQDAVKEKFGIVGRREMQQREALVLCAKHPGPLGWLPGNPGVSGDSAWDEPGHFSCVNRYVNYFTSFLENYLKIPIIDGTGITGRHNIEIRWQQLDRQHPTPEALKSAVLSQLGLELVPTNMPIEMLFVEKSH